MSDLERLAADLATDARELPKRVEQVVSKGALNVKNEWRDNARRTAPPHAKHYPSTISYDVDRTSVGASAEIGPDKARRQGPLGNLLEFGSVNNPPHNDGGRALDTEAPRFERAMGDLADGML